MHINSYHSIILKIKLRDTSNSIAIDMHVYLHIIGVDFRLCFWVNLRVHAFLVHSNEIANSLDDC